MGYDDSLLLLLSQILFFCIAEAMEAQKKSFELGLQLGYNKRLRDIMTWAKKRRRHIRREELMGFLCGKTPPPVKNHRHSPPRSRVSSRSHSDKGSPNLSPVPRVTDSEPDLTPFQNALAIQGQCNNHLDIDSHVKGCIIYWY